MNIQLDTSKYGIIYVGNQHYYKEDLSKRDYLLENTTPYYFKIGFDEFLDTSWLRLIENVTNYLISEYDPSKEELIAFSLEWSNKFVFSENKETTNSVQLENGLFLNCNYTALHSCWFLQDILRFFKVDVKDTELIIKRQPCVEKKEVRQFYINFHKEQFKKYIIKDLGKDEELFEKIVAGIDKIDPIFKEHYPTWVSLYLFDNVQYFYNYKKDFFEVLDKKTSLPEKTIEAIKKRINIYYDFMKK